MNLQSWILLAIILIVAAIVTARIWKKHREGRGGCGHCSSTTCVIKTLKKK